MALDVADLLTSNEINALERLDLLLFTRSHGDHYKLEETLELFKASRTHIVAESAVLFIIPYFFIIF